MPDVRVEGPAVERGAEVLTPEALDSVADLQTRFAAHRRLVEQVAPAGDLPDFLTLPACGSIRERPRPPRPTHARDGAAP
ncbi:hypothetical protein [Blastococcus haudaquaticus]|uniref:Malate synthase N-terminal domain-containing protein n=1 Tax=Blastococcus haudaquaticus TaxID=1938745 RepID=A0A286GJT3_9ACTN|nr:hypothetical protein [Blastococcus haudaquaticus]SOD95760.1 hypothetical protein SAMN06272739_1357 [Blastococcus haudaquaticus]